MSEPRQDFLLQPFEDVNGNIYYDFPLDDKVIDGVFYPTPYGKSDNQHKLDIIVNNLGALKRFPLLGFGVLKYEEGEYDQDSVNSALTEQMKNDGYTVKHGAISPDPNGGFIINTDLIVRNY